MVPRSLLPTLAQAFLCLVAGVTGGMLAMFIDAIFVRTVSGLWIPPLGQVGNAYLVVGLGVGIASSLGYSFWELRRGVDVEERGPDDPLGWSWAAWTVAAAAFAIVGLGAWERVERQLPAGPGFDLLAASMVGGSLGILAWFFGRVGHARERAWLGAMFPVIFTSTLLIANRTLIQRTFSLSAIVFTGVSLVALLVLLVLVRDHGKGMGRLGTMLLLGVSIALMSAGLLVATRWFEEPSPASGRSSSMAVGDRPHVLMVVFDTLRGDVFDDVLENSAEGQEFQQILGDVTWFTQHTATGAATPPTMSSVMSGLYPAQHGVDGSADSNWSLRIYDDVPLLAEVLTDLGYQSLAFVSNRNLGYTLGIRRGVERFAALNGPSQVYPLATAWRRLSNERGHRYLQADLVRRATVAGVRRHRDEERPLFLWLHFMDTHDPVVPRPGLRPHPGDAQLTDEQHHYRDAARFMLREAARSLEELRVWLPFENTLTFVLADHGEMLRADGVHAPGRPEVRVGHSHAFFDSIVRVPLGVQLPGGRLPGGGPPAASSDVQVSQVDLVPTVAAVLGIEWPRALPGCSLLPFVEVPADAPPCRDFAVASANPKAPRHRAFRTPLLKVMVSPENAFPPRLYELALDPNEQINRADEKPEAVAAAVTLLDQFWQTLGSRQSDGPVSLDPSTIESLKSLGYLQ